MAETYGIFEYKQVPVQLLVVLSLGLRENSRVKMAINNIACSQGQLMLAMITDYLAVLLWSRTKDAQHNKNKPKSLFEIITGKNKNEEIIKYSSSEEFERARENILGGDMDGN